MVKLNKIYTRTGDNGTSGLVDGSRRLKSDGRFAACGSIDEANAAIGLALYHTKQQTPQDLSLHAVLTHIQNDLFDLGADIATPCQENEAPGVNLRIVEAQITWQERQIDQINAALNPLKSFILPGGTLISCHLHLARTIVRRAERDMVALNEVESINIHALRYINRLSDLLFVAARATNDGGISDILWVPGKNR